MMNKAFKAAIEDARCATKLDHRFVKGYMRAAKCYMSVGQSASARDTLHQALEIEPKNKQIQQEVLLEAKCVIKAKLFTYYFYISIGDKFYF